MTNPLETFLSAYLRYPAFRPFCACILFHADLIILYASDLKGGFTHVLVVDGDEFWHPAELHRSLCLVANVARHAYNTAVRRGAAAHEDASRVQGQSQGQGDVATAGAAEVERDAAAAAAAAVPFARASMATYWRYTVLGVGRLSSSLMYQHRCNPCSLSVCGSWIRTLLVFFLLSRTVRGVVDPPEALRILWLVSLELCAWTKDREIECALPAVTAAALRRLQGQGGGDSNPANSSGIGAGVVFDGLMLDPSAGVCHHLSYVRTTAQLVHQKLASFAHAQDVLDAAEQRYNRTSNSGGGTGSSSNGLAWWISETWHKWEEVRCLFNF